MDVSKMLDEYIQKEGNGNTRDALNVALARSEATHRELLSLAKILREQDDGWGTFCAGQLDRIGSLAASPQPPQPGDGDGAG
jgi:hypothetical protein